jgi:hypothetical protein
VALFRSLHRLRPPVALRKQLTAGERLLALADSHAGAGNTADPGAGTVAATQLGLWLPAPAGSAGGDVNSAGWRRVDWDRVVKATWTDDGLQVIEGELGQDGIVTDLPALWIRLSEPRNLPTVVRTRVEASIARWEQVRVPGGTARVVARRKPGTDGLIWTARIDSGTPDTPQARTVLLDFLTRIAEASPQQL